MKKILLGIIGVLLLACVNVKAIELPEVTDHEKVTIYVFRGSGCSHCYEALTYLNSLGDTYNDYFEVVTYEIWNDSNNQMLIQDMIDYKNLNAEKFGVPYILVGDTYDWEGFASAYSEDIVVSALKEYQNPKYKDVVKELLKNNPNAHAMSLHDACVEEGIVVEKNPADTYIVLGVFVLLIGGLGALIIFSKN